MRFNKAFGFFININTARKKYAIELKKCKKGKTLMHLIILKPKKIVKSKNSEPGKKNPFDKGQIHNRPTGISNLVIRKQQP